MKAGHQAKNLAFEYGVRQSTIYDIKKAEEKPKNHKIENLNSYMKSTFKESHYPALDRALKIWFYQARAKNMHINTQIIIAQAKIFYKELYPNREDDPNREGDPNKKDFICSPGFSQRFCACHKFTNKKLCGKQLSSNIEAIEPFKVEFAKILEEFSTDQIYNADESGLNYKSLPNKSLTTAAEKNPSGTKLAKDRVTFLTCSNASGSHSLPITFILKVANPRCFQTGGTDPKTKKNLLFLLYCFKH